MIQVEGIFEIYTSRRSLWTELKWVEIYARLKNKRVRLEPSCRVDYFLVLGPLK
jgi:hypothetical protein